MSGVEPDESGRIRSTVPNAIPTLGQRLKPLLIVGYLVATIRITIEFWDRDAVMWFGLYFTLPVAIAFVGLTRRWGNIPWKTMAGTMVALAFLVWGICNSITYTIGQFMEWTDGRYYPGIEQPDGSWIDGPDRRKRASLPADVALVKVGWGLAHGFLSSLSSSVWCIVFGTLFVWLPVRDRSGTAEPEPQE